MVSNIASCSVFLLTLLPCFSMAQEPVRLDLNLEQSLELLHQENKSLKIAGKEVEWARNEHQKLNSFWYPSVTAAGAFVHMSNPIEVRQSLSKYTEPVKDFVQNYIPDNEFIVSVLDKIGQGTFTLPLISQNITTIDASVTWPVFTGGKRIYANKIGKAMVHIAEVNRSQVDATQQTLLIESYFGLRLGQSVVNVREEVYNSLKTHYDQALKLEQNGMINRAERLFAQVSMDEAKRELESARKDLTVARQAFKSLVDMSADKEVRVTTPLFINEAIPSVQYFKEQVSANNYIVNQLGLRQKIAESQLKIGRSAYMPTIALFGKQTLYADGLDKYLLPRSLVGVGFTWNIFDGLNREKTIRQARITSQSLELGKDKAITELEVGIDKFYSQLLDALDNVTALNTTIEMSRELVRVRQRSFQEGMATSTEVVDAEVVLAKVKTAFLLAYYQYDVALINLLSICGTPEVFRQYKENGKTEHLLIENEELKIEN